MAEVPLPGPANRSKWQSFDPATWRFYLSDMNAGRLVVFDVASNRVVQEAGGLPRVTVVKTSATTVSYGAAMPAGRSDDGPDFVSARSSA